MNFPNNMRWGNLDFKFIRPIRWLVALFGEEVIPFEVANVKSGRTSRGHRFLIAGKFGIATANDYVDERTANVGIFAVRSDESAGNNDLNQAEFDIKTLGDRADDLRIGQE